MTASAALLPHRGGGLAERVLVEQAGPPRCDEVAATEAAAVTLAGLTALQALHRWGRLRARKAPGGRPPRVLASGAAGGIGSFAVQLTALEGAEVTATTSAGKLAWVRERGADRVLDRRAEDSAPACTRPGPSLVLDAAGRSRYRDLAPHLAHEGIVVSVRPLHPDSSRDCCSPGRADFAAVRTAARSADLAHLLELLRTGRLRASVEHLVDLDDVARAHQLAESEGRGKVVVDLSRS